MPSASCWLKRLVTCVSRPWKIWFMEHLLANLLPTELLSVWCTRRTTERIVPSHESLLVWTACHFGLSLSLALIYCGIICFYNRLFHRWREQWTLALHRGLKGLNLDDWKEKIFLLSLLVFLNLYPMFFRFFIWVSHQQQGGGSSRIQWRAGKTWHSD